jgi:hypothetical protein
MIGHGLEPGEQRQLEERGYVVRERVFSDSELEWIRAACEALTARVVEAGAAARTPHIPAGSYVFQLVPSLITMLKWEPDHPEVVMGIEPFAHFDPELRKWGEDPRLCEPAQALCGAPEVELFTEKLNLKRGRTGGAIVLHQDHPYWVDSSEHPEDICTAVVFLDDSHRENGCLEVLPGSHRGGPRRGKQMYGFGKFELPTGTDEEAGLVALEVPAGSAVFFGSLLVHRSTPNRSPDDRRALLFSYQPAGRPASVEGFKKLVAK